MTEAEARESLDSDGLEREHAEKMKPIRLEKSREYRRKRKEIDTAKYVQVSEGYSWNNTYKTLILTQKQYQAFKKKTGRKDWGGYNAINPVAFQGKSLKTARPVLREVA
jgi:hypothetical protein